MTHSLEEGKTYFIIKILHKKRTKPNKKHYNKAVISFTKLRVEKFINSVMYFKIQTKKGHYSDNKRKFSSELLSDSISETPREFYIKISKLYDLSSTDKDKKLENFIKDISERYPQLVI